MRFKPLLGSMSFVLLLGFISMGLIGGCSSNNSSGNSAPALTENDFSGDPALTADPETGVVVTFLEPPDSGDPGADTGDTGVDEIPYEYTATVKNTFCWVDLDQVAGHFMTLTDGDGAEIASVEANGECVTAVIEPGNYLMHLFHEGDGEEILPVFIQPSRETDGAQAKNSGGGIPGTLKSMFSRVIDTVGFARDARAQTVEQNILTLLKTKACEECDLRGAKLGGVDLSDTRMDGAKLNDAILTGALLLRTHLSEADLTGADLDGAFVGGSSLLETNFTGANMHATDLQVRFMRGANLTNAILTQANMYGADLSGANIKGADFTDAKLLYATWVDGRVCVIKPSIGVCGFL